MKENLNSKIDFMASEENTSFMLSDVDEDELVEEGRGRRRRKKRKEKKPVKEMAKKERRKGPTILQRIGTMMMMVPVALQVNINYTRC